MLNFKIINKKFIIYLSLILFIVPQSFYDLGLKYLTSFTAISRYLITLTVTIYFLVSKTLNKYWKNSFILISFLTFFSQIVALLFNKSFYLSAAFSSLTFFGFILMNILFWNKDKEQLLKAYRNILYLYIGIDALSLLFFPNGLVPGYSGDGRVFFLGGKNILGIYIIVALLSETLYLKISNSLYNKNRIIILLALFTFLSFINKSSTTIICMLLVDIFYLILWTKKQKIMSYFIISLLIGVISFFVIFVLLGKNGGIITQVLTDLLKKDVTFSGRTAIWSEAINYIVESPIWGKGIDIQYDPWDNYAYVYSAHNTILDYIVKYGLLSFTFYFYNIVYLIKHSFINYKNSYIQITFFFFILVLLNGMFEALEGSYLLWTVNSILFINLYEKTKDNKMIKKILKKWYRFKEKHIGKKRLKEILKKNLKFGLYTGEARKERYIISMASFSDRFLVLPLSIKSLLDQTIKPDLIIIWLDEDDINKLTPDLKELENYGVEFRFTSDNLKAHKKYLYAMKEFPEANIITVDDDLVYSQDLVETLVNCHKQYPNAICARRVHKITFDKQGSINPYMEWEYECRTIQQPSFLLCATGGAGTIYPPGSLFKDFNQVDLIKELSLNADDIWLKFMEVLANKKVCWIKSSYVMPYEIEGSQDKALNTQNVWGGKNDLIIQKLLKKYPNFFERINSGRRGYDE